MAIKINEDNIPDKIDIIDGLNVLLRSFVRMAYEYDNIKDKDRIIEIMVDYILREAETPKNITRKAGSLNTEYPPFVEKFKNDVYKQLGHSSKAY